MKHLKFMKHLKSLLIILFGLWLGSCATVENPVVPAPTFDPMTALSLTTSAGTPTFAVSGSGVSQTITISGLTNGDYTNGIGTLTLAEDPTAFEHSGLSFPANIADPTGYASATTSVGNLVITNQSDPDNPITYAIEVIFSGTPVAELITPINLSELTFFSSLITNTIPGTDSLSNPIVNILEGNIIEIVVGNSSSFNGGTFYSHTLPSSFPGYLANPDNIELPDPDSSTTPELITITTNFIIAEGDITTNTDGVVTINTVNGNSETYTVQVSYIPTQPIQPIIANDIQVQYSDGDLSDLPTYNISITTNEITVSGSWLIARGNVAPNNTFFRVKSNPFLSSNYDITYGPATDNGSKFLTNRSGLVEGIDYSSHDSLSTNTDTGESAYATLANMGGTIEIGSVTLTYKTDPSITYTYAISITFNPEITVNIKGEFNMEGTDNSMLVGVNSPAFFASNCASYLPITIEVLEGGVESSSLSVSDPSRNIAGGDHLISISREGVTILELTFGLYFLCSLSDFAGSGTADAPYVIEDEHKLEMFNRLAENNRMNYFQLAGDIELGNAEAPWSEAYNSAKGNTATPRGFSPTTIPANGTLDCAGHTISNLYIHSDSTNVGFFSQVSDGAVIKNCHFENVNITGIGDSVGGIAGELAGTLENSYITGPGRVEGANSVGGLVGVLNPTGIISNSYGVVSLHDATGGTAAFGGVAGTVMTDDSTGATPMTGTITASYYDSTVATLTLSDDAMLGRTTSQLQSPTAPIAIDMSVDPTVETYVGWDDSIWDFGTEADYPVLITTTP